MGSVQTRPVVLKGKRLHAGRRKAAKRTELYWTSDWAGVDKEEKEPVQICIRVLGEG